MVVSAISEGWLSVDMPLPSSRQLAKSLGIARNTVLLAYRQLVEEEVLEARERRGYFVRSLDPGGLCAERRIAENRGKAIDWSSHLVLRPTQQHNIVKRTDWLNFPYPFCYGQCDPTLFPINDWRECARQALSALEIRGWTSDLVDCDDPELVEQIRTRVLPRQGIWAKPAEIMITLGAQQALFLLAELLVRPGMVVGMEEPGYPDARNILALKSEKLKMLPIGPQGIDPDDVPRDCRLLFLTPSLQCPTGASLSNERRERLLEIAEARNLFIIEDDYESNFGLTSSASTAMRSMEGSDRVLYVGSLSKIIAPGLRVGYIVASETVIREARALRRLMLRHAPTNNHRALALFLALGHFDRLLNKTVAVLEERSKIMRTMIQKYLPDFEVGYGAGGSSVWVKGPVGLDSRALSTRARDAGVLIEPGDVFFLNSNRPERHFRLGYCAIPSSRIESGLRILSALAADAKQS